MIPPFHSHSPSPLERVGVRLLFLLLASTAMAQSGNVVCDVENNYTLTLADLSVTISGNGGRIISFKRSGKEALTQKDVHPLYYEGTFWLSPQAENWPPSAEIDSEPYQVEKVGDTLFMTSNPDKRTGITVKKEFSMSVADTSFVLKYIVTNTSLNTIKVSPWDVLRTPPGLTLFPSGEKFAINNLGITGAFEGNGMIWCNTSHLLPDKGQKLFHTAKEGWIAHYTNDLLLIKCFPDISPEDLPPGQGEVEIFIAPKGAYIELENHGRYTTLLPGDTIVYQQKWFLWNIGNTTENKKD